MAEETQEAPEATEGDDSQLRTKVRWAIPQRLDAMAFVGNDILAVAHDIYIIFLNLRTGSEVVYVANDERSGDGVDVIAGHKNQIFAFAEKVKHPRIFVSTYPAFINIAEIKDMNVNRFKGLCMMECDMVAGFSGFPNYVVTVWSWRTCQRLLCIPTGVVRQKQLFMASRTSMMLCQCWGAGLIVWEVAQCYKINLMMRRAKEEATGWELSDPPLVDACWSLDGQLYAIDARANLYNIISDGIKMVPHLEWSDNLSGERKVSMCAFANGFLIYGPDKLLRSLKKCEHEWKMVWSCPVEDPVLRLVSNAACSAAALWTEDGQVFRVAGDCEEKVEVERFTYKQRNIQKIQLLAPAYEYLVTMNGSGVMCVYEVLTAKLMCIKYIEGNDISFEASPEDPLLVIYGEVGHNYGLTLKKYKGQKTLYKVSDMCLTHQIVSLVTFSPDGRVLVAAAMAAGHIFIMRLGNDFKLTLQRYMEVGRGLADCFLMPVGDFMRCFALVLFSDKYMIGERILCMDVDSGKDNKFAGKMMGPYSRLLPLGTKDTMVAIPHLSRQYHVLKLTGEKGITVGVKMGPIIDSGHTVKYFNGFCNEQAFITFGYDGAVIVRDPSATNDYELCLVASHRYESGVLQAVIDSTNKYLVHLGGNRTAAVQYLDSQLPELKRDPSHEKPDPKCFDHKNNLVTIIGENDKNYLDLQEDKKVREEAMDYKHQREEVVAALASAKAQLLMLLEENLAERPLHQLSLSEFNLHMEHKKERLKQAAEERQEIKLQTEARIRAQDVVTAWIKKYCWDTMLTPRVKLYAIFSHYTVENYAVLPTQRDNWPELRQVEALRTLEMENDRDLFRPWDEDACLSPEESIQQFSGPKKSIIDGAFSTMAFRERARSLQSQAALGMAAVPSVESDAGAGQYVLAGTNTHKFVTVPPYMIPQTLAFSFLQMDWLSHIVKLNVQNMRLWFNKEFNELMNVKKREVGLVCERNARLRFIIEELNKLSDLRGSFHHLVIPIKDPEWRQEENPQLLIKVDPEECSIEPYVSPSQVVVIPPEGGPKDDFRERALIEMMDGVLEKLWHEEIKKPIPMPQCMLDKDPEHFNEEDLKWVFDYEAKVKFRNEERDKYRKMLHAEYAKLSQTLDEGVVKFNMRVKETWLMKLRVDSVIGQEVLNLMRLRRTNLDRVERAEELEGMRDEIAKYGAEVDVLMAELKQIQEQGDEVQASYDALAVKDKYLDRTFKTAFGDISSIIMDQCYKYFKKRPKFHQRASMTPVVLYGLAAAVLAASRPASLHPDCFDYFKGVELLDQISNMPAVMDEALWATMVRLRRVKIENEMRMRAVALEMAYVESTNSVWTKAILARKNFLIKTNDRICAHRDETERTARNKTIQLVLPAGQVEITCSGHIEDFEDAVLIPREDIEKINEVILKVGAMKLRMMRKQMEFRKGILSKEWEHAQAKMKLRHMEQELNSYRRLKIPKELQLFLKNRELGYTDEQDYVRLEKEMEASKQAINKVLTLQIQRYEELQLKISAIETKSEEVEKLIVDLNLKLSEKRMHEDPLEPIRLRRILKKRMEILVARSALIREVQANHTTIVLLQTEMELLRLRTFPTLASFRTLS